MKTYIQDLSHLCENLIKEAKLLNSLRIGNLACLLKKSNITLDYVNKRSFVCQTSCILS